MKTIGHLLFFLIILSACTPDDLSKKNSLNATPATNQQPLDDFILAVQQNSTPSVITESTDAFIKKSPLSNLAKGSSADIAHLKSALVNATKSLITSAKKISLTKEQQCHNYEADIWWEVFWYMQSQPAIEMNEADVKAKEISTWAYQACSCSQQIQ